MDPNVQVSNFQTIMLSIYTSYATLMTHIPLPFGRAALKNEYFGSALLNSS